NPANRGSRQARHAQAFVAVVVLLVAAVPPVHAVMDATTECLVGFLGAEDGGTIEKGSSGAACTFTLQVCANRAEGSCTGTTLKPVKVMGRCKGASSLKFAPSGDTSSCGPAGTVTV